jgi:hypothetical protein
MLKSKRLQKKYYLAPRGGEVRRAVGLRPVWLPPDGGLRRSLRLSKYYFFYQTGSLKKGIYQCKKFGFKGERDIKIVKIFIYGALAYGTTYKQEGYSSKPVS